MRIYVTHPPLAKLSPFAPRYSMIGRMRCPYDSDAMA